jgi:hypothetical protein
MRTYDGGAPFWDWPVQLETKLKKGPILYELNFYCPFKVVS